MNCPNCEERLQQVLDGEALNGDRADVRTHLLECATCRELYDAAHRLKEGLRRTPGFVPPPDFANRIVAAVLRDRRNVIRMRWVAGIATAAAIIIAVNLVTPWLVSLASRLQPSDIAEQPKPVEKPKVEQPAPPPSFSAHLDETRSATLGLTKQVAEDTAGQVSLLVPAELFPATPLPPPMEPTALPVRDVGRSVSEGLEPVTSSAKRAWDMLLRDVPPMTEEKPGTNG